VKPKTVTHVSSSQSSVIEKFHYNHWSWLHNRAGPIWQYYRCHASIAMSVSRQ